MKALPALPTVSANAVIALGASSVAAAQACGIPANRGCGVLLPLEVCAHTDGTADLVDARTGALVSPCASAAIARSTKAFFQ